MPLYALEFFKVLKFFTNNDENNLIMETLQSQPEHFPTNNSIIIKLDSQKI